MAEKKEAFRIVVYVDGSVVVKTEASEVKGTLKGGGSIPLAMMLLMAGLYGGQAQ